MRNVKAWMFLAAAFTAMGCAEAGKVKGKSMEDQLKKMASEYQAISTELAEEKKSELEFKVLDLEWEGEYVATLPVVESAVPGIPILVMSRRSTLREWEVEEKKNSIVVATDLERGETWATPLFKPPVKKLKPQVEEKGRKPEPGEGYTAGVVRHVVGESFSDPLPQGEYAVAFIAYDVLSNQCRIQKRGPSLPMNTETAASSWPWNLWKDTKAFRMDTTLPKISGTESCVLMVEGDARARTLAGSVAVKARAVNLIPRDPKRAAHPEIQAAVRVFFLLFTLDNPPKVADVSVPILGSAPVHPGDSLKGWFRIPFPFEPSAVDRMLYAVVDGVITGPIRVPGDKP